MRIDMIIFTSKDCEYIPTDVWMAAAKMKPAGTPAAGMPGNQGPERLRVKFVQSCMK